MTNGLHQITKLLHRKGNNDKNEGAAYRMGDNLPATHLTGLISTICKELKKLNTIRTNSINK
jgi:hypothetical protein